MGRGKPSRGATFQRPRVRVWAAFRSDQEGLSRSAEIGLRRCYFLKTASRAACAMASSISDFAPLAAMPPIVLPSTFMGRPP